MRERADLLERFRRGAELVAVATTGAAGPVLDFRPAEGKWGVRTIVCHLADTEVVLSMRLRQVIAEDNPVLPAIQQDAWAERLDYSTRKLSHALAMVTDYANRPPSALCCNQRRRIRPKTKPIASAVNTALAGFFRTYSSVFCFNVRTPSLASSQI